MLPRPKAQSWVQDNYGVTFLCSTFAPGWPDQQPVPDFQGWQQLRFLSTLSAHRHELAGDDLLPFEGEHEVEELLHLRARAGR